MPMKWNKYVTIFKPDQNFPNTILVNYLNGKLINIDNKLAKLIDFDNCNFEYIKNLHPNFYNELINNEFIINKNIVIEDICTKNLLEYYNNQEVVRLTINPTLDCNLRCWYCYENHKKNTTMSQETIDQIIKYLNKNISDQTKTIQLSFFGGEPLIKYKNVVLPLCKRIKQFTIQNRINLSIAFTTNATLLSPQRIDELQNIHNNIYLQIPFDGSREQHNKTKHFCNSKGSYDIVLNNIKYAIMKDEFEVNIRCNYTLENIESFKDLISEFTEYKNKTNFYFDFHKVWQEPESAKLQSKYQETLNFLIRHLGIHHLLIDKSSICYADKHSNIIVNYDGGIFKCTARDFTEENKLGFLDNDGNIIQPNNKLNNRNNNILLSSCRQCKILPICNICSQKKLEFKDNICPKFNNTDELYSRIKQYINHIVHNI